MNVGNKKVLIWNLNIPIRNIGGPSGYLYNIKCYLENHVPNQKRIYFLSDLLDRQAGSVSVHERKSDRWGKWLKKADIFRFRLILRAWRVLSSWNKAVSPEELGRVNPDDYDFIHFHTSISLFQAIPLLRKYRGKILLTTHSPKPLSYEMADGLIGTPAFIWRQVREQMLKYELEAWYRADYLMFPVEEALEPYIVAPAILRFVRDHKRKFVYCPTAILDREFLPQDPGYFAGRCGIDTDRLKIVYIGRHNEVKGYDQLKRLALEIFKVHPDIYFIIGGKEYPLKGPDHPQWIELGWTAQAEEIIRNGDLFILPNKETYFDLIALEVLRTGTPLLLSETGGNKYFQRLDPAETQGMFFFGYSDRAGQVKLIEDVWEKLKNGKAEELRAANYWLFRNHFTMEIYLKRYLHLLDSLAGSV